MKDLKICIKCIQPNTRPGIFFNEKSVCGACLWEEEKKRIDWSKRIIELKNIVADAKKENSTYDCVIGVSGGKDSTKQALTARDTLGLRCLLVNYQPDNITKIGMDNIENLKQLGFDVISTRPNPKIMKKLVKFDFFNHLNPVKATEFSLYSSAYIIAEKFHIPLVIQGENPGLTVGTSLTGVGKILMHSMLTNYKHCLKVGMNICKLMVFLKKIFICFIMMLQNFLIKIQKEFGYNIFLRNGHIVVMQNFH